MGSNNKISYSCSEGMYIKMKDVCSKAKVKRKVAILLLLTMLVSMFSGCTPVEFTQEEKEAQLKNARAIFEKYLNDNYKDAKITDISEIYGVPEADFGYHLSDYVDGTFETGGKTYKFTVNTYNGNIYTSEKMHQYLDIATKCIMEELELSYKDIKIIDSTVIKYCVAMEDDPNNVFEDEEVSISNVLPIDIADMEEYTRQSLNSNDSEIRISICYSGDYIADKAFDEQSSCDIFARNSITIYRMPDGILDVDIDNAERLSSEKLRFYDKKVEYRRIEDLK